MRQHGPTDPRISLSAQYPLFATHLRFSFDETQVPLPRLGFPGDALKKEMTIERGKLRQTTSENLSLLPRGPSGLGRDCAIGELSWASRADIDRLDPYRELVL